MREADDGALWAHIGKTLANRPGVRVALVFGSRARGMAHAGSDLDLAVDALSVDLLALGAELSLELGMLVDVVSVDPIEASIPLLEAVIADGIVVHEATPGAGASWRARTLASLETDRPWYARMRDTWIQRVSERGFSDGQP